MKQSVIIDPNDLPFIPVVIANGKWTIVLAIKNFSVDETEARIEGELNLDDCFFSRECESEEAAEAFVDNIADALEEYRLKLGADIRTVTVEQVKSLLAGRFCN